MSFRPDPPDDFIGARVTHDPRQREALYRQIREAHARLAALHDALGHAEQAAAHRDEARTLTAALVRGAVEQSYQSRNRTGEVTL